MTTETARSRRLAAGRAVDPQPRVAALTAVGCVVLGLGAAAAGLVTAGGGAARGALLGAGVAAGVFVAGALAVHVCARVMPSASLAVALMTYLCQVLVAMMVLGVLTERGWLDDGTVSGPWLGAVLAACALLWVTVQIRVAATARVPLYELPDAGAR